MCFSPTHQVPVALWIQGAVMSPLQFDASEWREEDAAPENMEEHDGEIHTLGLKLLSDYLFWFCCCLVGDCRRQHDSKLYVAFDWRVLYVFDLWFKYKYLNNSWILFHSILYWHSWSQEYTDVFSDPLVNRFVIQNFIQKV